MDRRHRRLWAMASFMVIAISAPAVAVDVTLTSDEYSALPGAGCSLREAVESINIGASFGDCDFSVNPTIVTLGSGTYTLSIATGSMDDEDDNQTGDLDILVDMNIVGNGAKLTVIDGGDIDRVFDILSGTVELQGVTITGGRTEDEGGGIRNAGTLKLEGCWIDRNQAGLSDPSDDDPSEENRGGGIFSSGVLTVEQTTISSNLALGADGDSSGAVNGGAASGGGIYMDGAALEVRSSTISGNTAQGGAGNSPSSGDGGNGGASSGGGVTLADNLPTASASTLLNSATLTANSAVGGMAGAGTGTGGTDGTDGSGSGGGIRVAAGTFQSGNSIIVSNLADADADCSAPGGTLESLGYNLVGSGTGCPSGEAGDLTTADPGMGSLADNGGSTPTHALSSGSVAVLAGSPTQAGEAGPPPGCETSDQRDVSRPQNGRCDVGAYERSDLAITSHSVDPSSDSDNVIAGEMGTYSITVENQGTEFSFSTTLTDTLPAGTTLVSTADCLESPGAGMDDNGNPVCTLGTLAPLSSRTVTLLVVFDPSVSGSVINLVQVTSATDGISPVADGLSHIVSGKATLSLTHTPLTTVAAYDEQVDYLIVVSNASGPSSARDVTVTFTPNSGGLEDPDSDTGESPLTIVATSGCVEDPTGGPAGSPTCTLGEVEPGVPKQFTLTARVGMLDDGDGTDPGTIKLESRAEASTSTCADGSTSCSPQLVDADAGIDVQTDADLSITKTDNTLTAVVGQTVSYTIVVSNQIGPNSATGVGVTDNFPSPPLTCSWRCTPAGGAVCTTQETMGNITETGVTLPVGAAATYVADCIIDSGASGTTLENLATVSAPEGITDMEDSNDSARDTTSLLYEANLGITKTDGLMIATPGDAIVYTLEITNALGPSDAVGARVTDSFDSVLQGCTWSCAATGGAACGAASGSGDIDELVDVPVGGVVTYTVPCTVDASIDVSVVSSYQNTASVEAPSGVTETFPDDNEASDETSLVARQSDLALTGSASPSPVLAGETLSTTFTVSNGGPQEAHDVALQVILPSNVTFVSGTVSRSPIFRDGFESANLEGWQSQAQGSGCSVSGSTVTCDLGDLPSTASTSVTLTLEVATTATGTLSLTASVSATEGDSDETNNSLSLDVPITSRRINLVLSVSDSPDPVSAGATLIYTFVTTNIGATEATGVVLNDALPVEVIFASADPGCSLDGSLVSCDLGSLAVGGSKTTTIRVTVDSDATLSITNPASVFGDQVDSAPEDNTATEVTTIQ